MALDSFPTPRAWAEANFAAAELGDQRRTRRLVATAEQLAQQPQGSLPAHFAWNPLRAVYRLCNRPEVTHPAVTASHFAQTRAAMERASGPVLVLHDTTELNFTSHEALTGTGPVGDGLGRGFLQHNSLAILADTEQVLGLADQQLIRPRPPPRARPAPSGCTATANRNCGNAASAGSDPHRRGVAGSMSPIARRITSRRSMPQGNWAMSSSSAPAGTARSSWVRRPRARSGI